LGLANGGSRSFNDSLVRCMQHHGGVVKTGTEVNKIETECGQLPYKLPMVSALLQSRPLSPGCYPGNWMISLGVRKRSGNAGDDGFGDGFEAGFYLLMSASRPGKVLAQ
jgi:hypothetical protein